MHAIIVWAPFSAVRFVMISKMSQFLPQYILTFTHAYIMHKRIKNIVFIHKQYICKTFTYVNKCTQTTPELRFSLFQAKRKKRTHRAESGPIAN